MTPREKILLRNIFIDAKIELMIEDLNKLARDIIDKNEYLTLAAIKSVCCG